MSGPLRRCDQCQTELPAASYRCSACGARLDARLPRRPATVVSGLAIALFLALVAVLVLARLLS